MATLVASQVANPWQATKRTMAAVFAVLVPGLYILAEMLTVFADGFADVLPGSLIAWVISAAAFLTVAAGVATRIMAIPGVNEWLAKLKLSATPVQEAIVTNGDVLPKVPDYTPLDN